MFRDVILCHWSTKPQRGAKVFTLSNRHMSRGELSRSIPSNKNDGPEDHNYRDAISLSDSDPGMTKETDEDKLLPGDDGGLAGGYPPFPRAMTSDPDPAPTPAPAPLPDEGEGDDYAAYDPGMAGCTTEPSTCHIPGMPRMGPEHLDRHRSSSPSPSPSRARNRPIKVWVSRGYERDGEEYETEPLSSSSSLSPTGGASASAGGADPDRLQTTKPPIGTRIVGPSISCLFQECPFC